MGRYDVERDYRSGLCAAALWEYIPNSIIAAGFVLPRQANI